MKTASDIGFYAFALADMNVKGEYRTVAIRMDDVSAVADASEKPGDIGCVVYLRGGKKLVLAEFASDVLLKLNEPEIAYAFTVDET